MVQIKVSYKIILQLDVTLYINMINYCAKKNGIAPSKYGLNSSYNKWMEESYSL